MVPVARVRTRGELRPNGLWVQRVQPVINSHAAGADMGARKGYVAIFNELDVNSMRRFDTFTADL